MQRFMSEPVELRDGRVVTLRPIRRDDAPRLRDLHRRLSPDSQYLRFFGPKPKLTKAESEYLAGVDFDRRFAIVATIEELDYERIVAVGRFDMGEGGEAEAALVVRDDYQGAGLGSAILERLILVARGRGVKAFAGEVLAENGHMLALLRKQRMEIGPPHDAIVHVSAQISEEPLAVSALKMVMRETWHLTTFAWRPLKLFSSTGREDPAPGPVDPSA